MLDLLFPIYFWLARRICPSLGPKCVRISINRVIKGPTGPAESDALQFVAANTNLRVPKVYRTYDRRDGFYIEMEYIHGQQVGAIWATITGEEKDHIVKQLADCVSQLHQHESKVRGIGSVTMKQMKDVRLSYTPFGPFQNVADFHTFVRKTLPLEKASETFGEDVFRCHSSDYKVVMSHSDICLRNMIIDHQGSLVLVDWEFAGWWPEYWDYTKSFYALFGTPDFYELIEKHFVNYDMELRAERQLWKMLNQPWTYD